MRRSAVLLAGAVCVFALLAPAASFAAQQPVKVLVITGGHDYEKEPFDAMFKALDGIVVETAEHKETSEGFDKDLSKYDVIVLYDMAQKITDAQKKNLMKFLGEAKGLVSLHHNLGSYQDWEQYQRIIHFHFGQVALVRLEHSVMQIQFYLWEEGLVTMNSGDAHLVGESVGKVA